MRVSGDLERVDCSETNEGEEQDKINYLRSTPGSILDHSRSNQDSGIFFLIYSMYNIYIMYTEVN